MTGRRRRRRAEESHLDTWERDAFDIPSRSRLLPTVSLPEPADILVSLEDGRYWTPEPDPWPSSLSGTPAPLSRKLDARSRFVRPEIRGFSQPENVVLCVRRKERREILHALKRTRSGRGKSRRRTYWSSVRC